MVEEQVAENFFKMEINEGEFWNGVKNERKIKTSKWEYL